MKLLHVTATHLNLLGGIPVVLKNLTEAQNLIDGFESRVLSVSANVDLMDSPFFIFLGKGSFSDYLDEYKPDFVIFHSHYCFKYLKMYRACLKRNIPYFIEPHGSFGLSSLRKSKWKKFIANQIFLRRFMKNAIGYVFLNQREMRNSLFRKAGDMVIPNGISITNHFIDEDLNKEFSFYFIGRYDINHKGLDVLFDSLDLLEQKKEIIQIDFFGKGSPEAETYLKNRCRNYKNVVVRFNAPVYGVSQEVALNQKGIMILVSRYEGFPMTVLEAWKFGNPCLVTEETNVADEIVKNGLGWVTELRPEMIAETIEVAKKEYDANKNGFVKKCKSYVREKYNWNIVALQSFNELKKVQRV